MLRIKFVLILLVLSFAPPTFASADYKRLKSTCKSCIRLEAILDKQKSDLKPDDRLDQALKVASIIKSMSIKDKKQEDRQREIYFAIKASRDVLADDFDSETVFGLIKLRAQAPADFDHIFWRIPLQDQKHIIERMQAFKTDKLVPNTTELPVAKAEDDEI